MKRFEEFGICVPEILLPKNLQLKTWATVACDQYTQSREYWQKVKDCVGLEKSTLNIIFPEVYLNDSDKDERIAKIKQTMNEYLDEGVFGEPKNQFIYIERKTAYGRTRKGLVLAIDLESYEWKPFSKKLIRATEATILERLPPRMKIRSGASIEIPHIMLLVNDSEKSLVEETGKIVKQSRKNPVYSGELMQNSGEITGWGVETQKEFEHVLESLKNLAEKNTTIDENGEKSTFLFAVGDGNHSLATAKAVWDEYKKSHPETTDAPLRYALVEVVNIFDEGLTFEPIHRVVFNGQSKQMIDFLAEKLGGTVTEISCATELEETVKNSKTDFGFVYKDGEKSKYVLLSTKITDLAVAVFQPILDEYLKGGKMEIDYIHGVSEIFRLAKEQNVTGVIFPPIVKTSFFETINNRGPLPRKSFSMGEADEKRFYIECRKII